MLLVKGGAPQRTNSKRKKKRYKLICVGPWMLDWKYSGLINGGSSSCLYRFEYSTANIYLKLAMILVAGMEKVQE